MNKIEGKWDKSDYEGFYDFINYYIDNYWPDEKLDDSYPNNMYKGLIPTLVPWMDRKDEEIVVWDRILPEIDHITICPILMCPDDCDFSCTLIVAEIQNYGDFIQWKKLGIDRTEEWDADKVGSKVEWFNNFGELNFAISDYNNMLDSFKSMPK